MSDQPPLIFVDLIEDKFPTPEEWTAQWPGSSRQEYQKFKDRYQPFRLVIKSGDNHRALFRSTESYFNAADAIHAAQLAFGHASNVYLRQPETGNQLLRMAQP